MAEKIIVPDKMQIIMIKAFFKAAFGLFF